MAETPMVNLTIEGQSVQVAAGTSILEAAKTAGVLIPHYCYHPSLPVAGVCRMCLVEVEKAPKLLPSCATTVAEGQVVHVYSEKALEARKGVLELLLINHPLDCPICDQSGECELQDYTFAEGRQDSRYHEPKRFDPVEDFGGDVLYVGNRCILCTRCVRFMEDVHQNPVIEVQDRGDRARIGKAPDNDLTQAWAANVVDLCPVGALLSKDFLNKARAWELDRTASVCNGCSQGCNIVVETRDNTIMRYKPRANDEVNKHFMCDEGRLNYAWLNRPDRITWPHAAGSVTGWDSALGAAAAAIKGKKAYVVVNPSMSNETLYALKQLITKSGGAGYFSVAQGPEAPLPGVADLAVRADRAANATGAELLGFTRSASPLSKLTSSDVLVLVDVELTDADKATAAKAAAVVVLGTAVPHAIAGAVAVLPITNYVEEEGTFTNLRGRVQRYLQAKATAGAARPAWYILSDLLTTLGEKNAYFTASATFDALAKAEPAFAGMSYDTLGLRGTTVHGAQVTA
ncbi:MAG: 2Fe-2S iron-sulfur cluster-binding protein [Gemmatimonadetes bacterium]|nr:2Fe-2S iron-sulfur cluster-binding protein [Gemmatimonadota bacterium]